MKANKQKQKQLLFVPKQQNLFSKEWIPVSRYNELGNLLGGHGTVTSIPYSTILFSAAILCRGLPLSSGVGSGTNKQQERQHRNQQQQQEEVLLLLLVLPHHQHLLLHHYCSMVRCKRGKWCVITFNITGSESSYSIRRRRGFLEH